MPLEWLSGGRQLSLSDLIARRKYGRAIELLTARLEKETPTVQARLQLADLLVMAGRSAEAVPVFLKLADDFTRDGFVAKAIAILKRVERLAPGPEVETRLEELARTQQRLSALSDTPAPSGPATIPFGIEEIRDEPELAPEGPRDPEAGDAAPLAPATPAPAAEGEPGAERDRVHSAFRRFLESMRRFEGEEPDGGSPEPAGQADEPEVVDASELAFGGEAPPAPEAGEEPDLPEEVFEGRILDAIEDVLRRPSPDAGTGGSVPEPGRRLLAVPLLEGLDQSELLAVMQGLELRRFRPGDVILTEGERGQSVFLLTEGTVRVYARGPSGRNVQLGTLGDGDFFGEISGLSGRPRTATITCASWCELLELAKPRLDAIARRHPRVREQLEQRFVERAGSPEAAAVRAVPLEERALREAREVLSARFGESRWDPRMRLQLARVLVESGKEDEAVPVLIALADELSRAGQTAKAVAVIKKVEQIRTRHVREIPLAPLRPRAGASANPTGEPGPQAAAAESGAFQAWLVDMLRDRLAAAAPQGMPLAAPVGYAGLEASPLFAGFSEEELVALFQGFQLRRAEPGDLLVTEGERAQGVFVLCAGRVRVFVRSPDGRDVELCELGDGAFFGEMATLSGKPRSATVCAATACDLLELDRDALEVLSREHPRVRRVLEEFVAVRASSEEAARIRGLPPEPEAS